MRAGHPHARRVFIAASASVAALVMVVSGIAMAGYYWTDRQRTTFGGGEDTLDEPVDGVPTPTPDVLGRCAEQACNYLLLGSDSREGLTPEEQVAFGTDEDIGGENRSDTIILVHTRPGQKQAIFLSFPRDLWVDIPGMGMGKINSAFEGGIDGNGELRVARAVKDLTGLQIHHVLYVSLAGFQGLVDALGGVDMCVPFAMQDELTGLDIEAGCQRFDGATALAYVRTRHQPCDERAPDFARISRQQQFLRAVIGELLEPSALVRLPSLVPELLGNLVVDEGLNVADLVYLADTLQGVGTENADFRSVPSVPDGVYDSSGTYLSIVQMVQPDANELFERIRENRDLGELGHELPGVAPSPANIVVSVVDKGAGVVAEEVSGVLTDGGFNTAPGIVSAQVTPPTTGPMILFRGGAETMAEVVGTYFPNLELVPAPAGTLPSGQDVAVVVTSGYEIPAAGDGAQVECPT
jgi:LCP family protein required for cell wall assembly